MSYRISSILSLISESVKKKVSYIYESKEDEARATSSEDANELHRLHNHDSVHVRRAVANNPRTGGHTLHAMRNDADVDVQKNVAKNGNANADTLHHLRAMGHGKEVEENPALDMHKLEDPNFDDKSERHAVAKAETPDHVLHQIALKRPDLHHEIVAHGNTSTKTLHHMLSMPQKGETGVKIVTHKNADKDFLRDAHNMIFDRRADGERMSEKDQIDASLLHFIEKNPKYEPEEHEGKFEY